MDRNVKIVLTATTVIIAGSAALFTTMNIKARSQAKKADANKNDAAA